jgi:hypothetical protein
MGFFDSNSETFGSASDQGSQSQDEAQSTNINLSAGDDQSATVNVTRNETTNIEQTDNSDNSVTQIDNSDRSTTQIDNSDRSKNQISNSNNRINDSRNQSVTQIDNSRTIITSTDQGSVKKAFAFATRSLDAVERQTEGLFATVDDVLELQGALTDETLELLSDSFDRSVDQIQESATSEVERSLDAVFGLTRDMFLLIGGIAAIYGVVQVYR